jgi:hypothetical protein
MMTIVTYAPSADPTNCGTHPRDPQEPDSPKLKSETSYQSTEDLAEHPSLTASAHNDPAELELCQQFALTGWCSWGARCPYIHVSS